MIRAAKVDRNQREIVTALRKMGAVVLITSQLKNAFDILVGYRGKLYMIEIKDGELPPSRHRLSEGEQKCCDSFAGVGVGYHVIKSIDEALELLAFAKHLNTKDA